MGVPQPKKLNRAAVMARMKEVERAGRADVKAILYPMPDLTGPGGNALALLGQASALMKTAKVSEALRDRFHAEAISGNYDKVLDTIGEWFTVVVAETKYVPYEGSMSDLARVKHSTDEATIEEQEMAAREQYEQHPDPEEPEVLDLRGMDMPAAMKRLIEKSQAHQQAQADTEEEKEDG